MLHKPGNDAEPLTVSVVQPGSYCARFTAVRRTLRWVGYHQLSERPDLTPAYGRCFFICDLPSCRYSSGKKKPGQARRAQK